MQVPDASRLRSIEVRSADGELLGRVGAVYISEGLTQPLLVAFPDDSATPLVAPLFGAELTAEGLVLSYPAQQVTSGPTVEADAPLSVGVITTVLTYYGRPVAVDRPLTERADGVGDVSGGFADVHTVPRITGIGDDDLPPIVVTRPAHSG
ncbi:hypothetical protein Ari01nite_74270 [Paractinoplanes rishiriensis]|uniref:PRC-barrel domain-containing protein n=1 Tax=Paractinoplanes rishiriensis TaxID=1050105 RepID=A0A919K5Z5_9ACTN|nr:hypothetical protein Ari01nite_74270 [Actinoplanes rishiriensis]